MEGARAGADPERVKKKKAKEKKKGENFFSWFFFALSAKQRNTRSLLLAPDSASAPVSSGAVDPAGQAHEARTWAKEAMTEKLREAGERRLTKKGRL